MSIAGLVLVSLIVMIVIGMSTMEPGDSEFSVGGVDDEEA